MLWNFPLHAAQSRAGGDSHQTGAIPVVERSVLHGPQPDACVAEDGIDPWLFWQESPGREKYVSEIRGRPAQECI